MLRLSLNEALVIGYDEINDALEEIAADNNEKAESREKDGEPASKMNQLETGILAALWHPILDHFHGNSQALQALVLNGIVIADNDSLSISVTSRISYYKYKNTTPLRISTVNYTFSRSKSEISRWFSDSAKS